MDFLPDDYESPKATGDYMKFVDGENKFRILSKPILGWEDWINNKPVRYRMTNKPAKPRDEKKPLRHFWSMIVFNYAEERIQILNITQAKIRKALEALSKDADWGSPYTYDIKVIRQGEGMETDYSINPIPHKPVHEYILTMFKEKPIYLEALFDNLDPFSKDWSDRTPLGISKPTEPKMVDSIGDVINDDQCKELEDILNGCDANYKIKLLRSLIALKKPVKELNKNELAKLPIDIYEKIKVAALKNRDEYQKSTVGVPF